VFLDIVINHTGWGSNLQENHPEWFLRGTDGTFQSPGAWGTTWEDLVELEHRHVELWDYIAEVLLTWCGRGVDGFRCDAGYKVPLAAWQYIIARVRQEFPETLFLLEGLGGAWEITEQLLTEGGMQWAYSELFQNYSGLQVGGYLDHSLKQSRRCGLLVNYSETHDNERVAKRGRGWSLLRNRLCALVSVSGGFGFTCGVEWLAPERVNVHSSRGLAWDNPENIVPELAQLNRLLSDHPCFFEGAKLTRLSAVDAPVYALRRDSENAQDSLLVLVNTDDKLPQTTIIAAEALQGLHDFKFDLAGQMLPKVRLLPDQQVEFTLSAGACHCLSPRAKPLGLSGEEYRRARARAAWALQALAHKLPIEEIPAFDWLELARIAGEQPAALLAAASASDAARVRFKLEQLVLPPASTLAQDYEPVVVWNLLDRRRILPVPPGHWLLILDSAPFRATLKLDAALAPQHALSIPVRDGYAACFAPGLPAGDAQLTLERYAPEDRAATARIRFLAPGPELDGDGGKPLAISNLPTLRDAKTTLREVKCATKQEQALEQPIVLLTNGIGGMARLCVDFGAIKSKYDCLLGANLHPCVPVDRHVFAKRARLWVNADGFITPLDLRNLATFVPGPPAVWHFIANAGDGRTVEIQVTAAMLPGRNTTVLRFARLAASRAAGKPLPVDCDVRLTLRVDIEDRNFHWETKRNAAAEHHFATNTRPLAPQIGFIFMPAPDRRLRVFSDKGIYHPQAEWAENIPHPVEQSRGQTASGDAYSPGWFDLPMPQDGSVTVVVCADADDPKPAEILSLGAISGKSTAAAASKTVFAPTDEFGRQLLRAAGAFVVRRDEGITVIAGYPWFLDWGRDSLICARGLLAAGMTAQVKQLLVVFGRFQKDGTLPNTIHGEDASNRDTSDAPLWYGIVCEELAATSRGWYQAEVQPAGPTVAGVLADIARNYIKGTPNGIRMDAASGLIWSPSHFTWMDTNFPAGTPREGYPVEIQVLWIRLLRQLQRAGAPKERPYWQELADRAQASLLKYFWLEDRGYLADLLVAKAGKAASEAVVDNALRSNSLLAVSLGLLTGRAAQRCVIAAQRYLVVPGALRTLAPLPVSPPLPIYGNQGQLLNNPPEPYWGRYEGDEDTRRKPAYHNGTAWTWTFPIFCEALAKAWDGAPEAVAAARAYLGSMDKLLMTGCVGQIPEIVDGDTPHIQRGCDAQAWGVTEALRVWRFLRNSDAPVMPPKRGA
jgi:predicted glycogen debranching enzyme